MQTTVITPEKTWKKVFSELWEYHEVLLFLSWRDILVHYKQTILGIAWVVIRPVITVAIFTIIFSKIAGIETNLAPYPLVVFSAMLVWQFFVDMLTFGSNSFLANEQLISKVYFPRLILPASRILCSLIDFSISLLCYLLLSLVRYHQLPPLQILLLPIFLAWLILVTFSISLFFASLVVRYRDFRHVIPFIAQLGLYCTSVGFTLSMVPLKLRYFLALNPLISIINGFRYCLINEQFYFDICAISALTTILISGISIWYFKSVQDTFADLV